jgi:expansin (peptidoglycan-binding protein)
MFTAVFLPSRDPAPGSAASSLPALPQAWCVTPGWTQRLLPLAVGLALLLGACGGGGRLETGAAPGSGGSGSGVPTSAVLGSVHRGQGTYYDLVTQGNCTLDPVPDHLTAAMNAPDYANAAVCGAYVEVSGPRGTVTVRISDQCPECAAGDLDLTAEAFPYIADPVVGRVPIIWKVVPGPVNGPLQYRYKEGSSIYWTAIQVRNSKLPISKLEIRPAGSPAWIEVARTSYNYFIHEPTVPAAPLRVRVTASNGAQLEDEIPAPQAGLLVSGKAQFP